MFGDEERIYIPGTSCLLVRIPFKRDGLSERTSLNLRALTTIAKLFIERFKVANIDLCKRLIAQLCKRVCPEPHVNAGHR